MQGAQGSLTLIQQMWNTGLARRSDPAHDAQPRRFDMYSEGKCAQHMLRAGDSISLTHRMSRIQDDLEHCAPPDRHVATQIATWPQIIHLTREMQIRDAPGGAHAALECAYPSGEEGTGVRSPQPPAAGLISRQQDTYFIPPSPRAVGGARGNSAPASTATLGLIH